MKRHLSAVAMLALLLLLTLLAVAGCTRDSVAANITAPIVEAAREHDWPEAGGVGELQTTTNVVIKPASQSVNQGQTTVVEVEVQNVTGLYGVDIRLNFDPTRLEVQDADAGVSGVQIEPGPFLNVSQGFVAQNSADNTAGSINYAMTLLSAAPAVSGTGVVMRITFKGIAAGTSAITFRSALLSDRDGQQIPANTTEGTVTVTGVVVPTNTPTPTATPTQPSPAPTATRTPVPAPTCIHVVTYGDTLYSLARRYGTTVSALAAANNLRNPNFIWVGQRLVIPGCQQPPPPPPQCTRYTVLRGDTLYALAARYGTTAADIAARNGIRNWNFIWVGQRLTICPGGVPGQPGVRYHTVRRGETLWSIAARYGTSPWAIAVANNIPNPNLIFVGQVLRIP